MTLDKDAYFSNCTISFFYKHFVNILDYLELLIFNSMDISNFAKMVKFDYSTSVTRMHEAIF